MPSARPERDRHDRDELDQGSPGALLLGARHDAARPGLARGLVPGFPVRVVRLLGVLTGVVAGGFFGRLVRIRFGDRLAGGVGLGLALGDASSATASSAGAACSVASPSGAPFSVASAASASARASASSSSPGRGASSGGIAPVS